jgi:hypothetical protein
MLTPVTTGLLPQDLRQAVLAIGERFGTSGDPCLIATRPLSTPTVLRRLDQPRSAIVQMNPPIEPKLDAGIWVMRPLGVRPASRRLLQAAVNTISCVALFISPSWIGLMTSR